MYKLKEKKRGICEECGKSYIVSRPWQKFCDGKCRWANYDKRHPRVHNRTNNLNDISEGGDR